MRLTVLSPVGYTEQMAWEPSGWRDKWQWEALLKEVVLELTSARWKQGMQG